MYYTEQDVLEFVAENEVKFIRLAFCDLFGAQKNIAIGADVLPRAFSQGIGFDASAVEGFLNVEQSDLLLFPDPATLSLLPWRPSIGRAVRMFCDIRYPDGTPFEGDNRRLLRIACERAEKMGYQCRIGAECEFYLFELDERGNPTPMPIDRAGYLDMAPVDRGENIRRDICLTLQEMGIRPESFHHEQGPGQNEIDFVYSDAFTAADQLVTFKGAVKTMAAQNGMYASFMPKPLQDAAGSGLHVNMSLTRDGKNIFQNEGGVLSPDAECFIAGVLLRVREMTALLNPLTNSYARLGVFEAPRYVSWSHSNRSQLVRIPAAGGDFCRMELRSPDPASNPYLCFALLLHAGLDGIEQRCALPAAAAVNLYDIEAAHAAGLAPLPATLGEALDLLHTGDFVRRFVPEITLQKFVAAKRREQAALDAVEDKRGYEHKLYFNRY